MNYTQVVVSGVELDGIQDADFALSYGLKDIRDLARVTGNKSTTITIPRTKTNDKAFGIPSEVSFFGTPNKNTAFPAYVLAESLTVFDGSAYLLSCNDTEIEIALISGVSSVKEIIGEGKLKDLNLSDLTHTWSDAAVFNSWTAGNDYVYPLVDYGALRSRVTSTTTTPFNELFPAVYVERILKQICLDNNIILDTTLFNRPALKKLMLCFGNGEFVHTERWVTDRKVIAVNPIPNVYVIGAVLFIPIVVDDVLGQWDPLNYEYTANEDQTVNVNLIIQVASIAGTPQLKLEYYDTGLGVWADIADTAVDITTPYTAITAEFNLLSGWKYRAFVDLGALEAADITAVALNSTVDKVVYRESEVDLAINLPDWSQLDFLRVLIQAFNLYCDYDNSTGVLKIETYDDFFTGEMLDWSDKLDLSKEIKRGYVDDYLKQNLSFEYDQPDDDVRLNRYNRQFPGSTLFGNGTYELDNSYNKSDPQKIADLKLRPIYSGRSYHANQKYIRLPTSYRSDAGVTQETGIGPFWMIFAGMTTVAVLSDGTKSFIKLTEASISTSNIPMFYFVKQDYDDADLTVNQQQLSFDVPQSDSQSTYSGLGLKETFYGSMLQNFNTLRTVSAFFKLTNQDVANLNLRKPIYVDYFRSTFIINKIEQFNPNDNESTQVELIRVNR